MKAWPLVLCLSALAALAGCGKQDGAGHAASHAKDEHAATHDKAAPAAEAGHGHDHGAGTEKLTHFTERTELFVEFAPLVVGEKSAFAAHVSRLSDFRAVTAGKLSVHLSSEGQPEEVFAVDAPTQPGIFRPEATPKHAGERELSIKIATAEFSVTHALGPVTVHANRKAAEAESAEHEDEGIAFTKEQQWKVDFATAEVVQRPIRAAIDATGTLRARPDGEALLSAPATGQIQSAGAFPRLGQSVDKGQVLAHLVPRMGGDTDVATLRADVAKAKIEHDLAREELARLEGLYRDEAVPEKRVHAARAAAATARAQLSAAQQRLGQHSGAGGGVPLRAPVAGVLIDVRAVPGAYAQEGALLFHIADRRSLWLELRVPESAAAQVASASGAAFKLTGDTRSFEIVPGKNGRLVAVGGVVDAVTRTLPVVFEFSAAEVHLLHGQQTLYLPIGMAVQGQVFTGNTGDAVAIPASSVLDENGIAMAYLQTGGESFEPRTLRLGAREGDWVQVLDGLTPGQRVVSRGAYLVKLAAANTGEIGHGHAH